MGKKEFWKKWASVVNIAEVMKWTSYFVLIAIWGTSLFLVCLNKDGVGIGFLGLVSWCIVFSKIKCVKIEEYEIQFLTKQEKLDEYNRKLLYDNYIKVKNFSTLFWEHGRIEKEGFNLISDAYLEGKLFLPDTLLKKIEKLAEAARKSYVLEMRLQRQQGEKDSKELNQEIVKINADFYNLDPTSLYRDYFCIK